MALGALKTSMALTMALLFGTLAAVFGLILWLAGPDVGVGPGIAMALAFSLVMTLLQWFFAPALIKLMTRMKEAGPAELPWLRALVEKHAKKAGIRAPRLFVVADPTPNAFAFGRTKNNSNIAVHSGLLEKLSKEEVEGVVAHEVGHIRHRDMVVITLASMVPMLVYYGVVFAGSVLLGRGRDRGGGGTIAVWLGAYAAQFLSFLIVMHLSRTREYYADAYSAVSTGKPLLLQSALSKIAYGFPANAPVDSYKDKRAFYVADPVEGIELARAMGRSGVAAGGTAGSAALGGNERISRAIEWERRGGFTEFFSTHPLAYKRLAALEKVDAQMKAGRLSLANV